MQVKTLNSFEFKGWDFSTSHLGGLAMFELTWNDDPTVHKNSAGLDNVADRIKNIVASAAREKVPCAVNFNQRVEADVKYILPAYEAAYRSHPNPDATLKVLRQSNSKAHLWTDGCAPRQPAMR